MQSIQYSSNLQNKHEQVGARRRSRMLLDVGFLITFQHVVIQVARLLHFLLAPFSGFQNFSRRDTSSVTSHFREKVLLLAVLQMQKSPFRWHKAD